MQSIPLTLQQNIYKQVFSGVLKDLERKTKDFGLYIAVYYTIPYTQLDYQNWFSNKWDVKEYRAHLKPYSAAFHANKRNCSLIGR